MPRISTCHGTVIEMYYGDHPPPHLYAGYAGRAAKIEIATAEILVGDLPGRAHRLVREWVSQHRDELYADWERAVSHKKPQPIDPLP